LLNGWIVCDIVDLWEKEKEGIQESRL